MSSTGDGIISIPMFPPFIESPVIGFVVETSSVSESWIVIAITAKITAIMIKIVTLLFVSIVC